jgi:hypothetical protein
MLPVDAASSAKLSPATEDPRRIICALPAEWPSEPPVEALPEIDVNEPRPATFPAVIEIRSKRPASSTTTLLGGALPEPRSAVSPAARDAMATAATAITEFAGAAFLGRRHIARQLGEKRL